MWRASALCLVCLVPGAIAAGCVQGPRLGRPRGCRGDGGSTLAGRQRRSPRRTTLLGATTPGAPSRAPTTRGSPTGRRSTRGTPTAARWRGTRPTGARPPREICNNGIDDNYDGKIDWRRSPVLRLAMWRRRADPGGLDGRGALDHHAACLLDQLRDRDTRLRRHVPPRHVRLQQPREHARVMYDRRHRRHGRHEQLLRRFRRRATRPAAGACGPSGTAGGFSPTPGFDMAVAPAPYAPGACTAAPTTTISTIASTGQTCAFTESVGAGCNNNGGSGACVPTASGSYHYSHRPRWSRRLPHGDRLRHSADRWARARSTTTRGCTPCSDHGADGDVAQAAAARSPQRTPACTDAAAVSVNANGTCGAFPRGWRGPAADVPLAALLGPGPERDVRGFAREREGGRHAHGAGDGLLSLTGAAKRLCSITRY